MKMISKNTAKLIRYLLRNIEKYGHNINKIAKSIDISVGSSFKILKDLEKSKLSSYAKLYSESLKEFKKAELIVLFGSILKKKEFNDVDVLFIANPKEVNDFCLELSKTRT